jgi:hypothetical protein
MGKVIMNNITVLFGILSLLISGCATQKINAYQTECEKKTTTFAELSSCLQGALETQSSSFLSDNSGLTLYVLKAEQLSQKIQKGEISEIDARVTLQELYVKLENEEKSRAKSINTDTHQEKRCTTYCTVMKGNVCQGQYETICR